MLLLYACLVSNLSREISNSSFLTRYKRYLARELQNSGSKTIKYEKKLRQVCKFAQHSRQLRCLHSLSSILHLSDNKLKQNQRAGQGECCNYCESLWIWNRKDLTLTPILNKV